MKQIFRIIILTILIGIILITPFIAQLSNPQPVKAASSLVQTIIGGGYQWVLGANTYYFPLMGYAAPAATEANVMQLVPLAGTLSNFYIKTSAAVTSHVYTIRVGGASTAMTVTLTGTTSGSYTASTISVPAVQNIDVMCVSTDAVETPYIYWTVDFTPTGSTTKSIMLCGSTTVIAGARYMGATGTYLTPDATEINRSQVVPTAGTISTLYVYLSADPGAAGDSYTFTLYKNGAPTALTCTIDDPNQLGSDVANSIAVVASDLVSIEIAPGGGPASAPYCSIGMVFTATNNYESIVMSANNDNLNPAATEYNYTSLPVTGVVAATVWTATEASRRQIAGAFTAKNLYISLSGSPDTGGGTQSYTIAIRNTGTTTALSVTISEASTTGNYVATGVDFSRGEFMTMISIPIGTPTARFARWSFVTYYNPDVAAAPTWDQCAQKDYFTTGGDAGGSQIYGATYGAQSFTTTSAYIICYVKISLQRTGAPGTLTLSIFGTNAIGDPSGDALAYATFNGDTLGTAAYTWATFNLLTSSGEQLSLEKSKKYVLVLKALNGSGANYVQWYADTAAGYASGNANISTDGGSSWNQFAMAGYDYLFEFWGKASMTVIDAKVFKSYKQANDWLIVCHYFNKAAPHYPIDDVTNYFYLKFKKGTTEIARVPCQQWGERPGSIYMNALKVIPLEWDKCATNSWNVEIVSISDATVTATYTMVDADWRGTDLDELDAYCLGIAKSIEDNAVTGTTDADLIVDLSDKGTVFNDNGAVIFNKGVNGLSSVRPNLFATSTGGTNTTGRGISWQPSWQDNLGPYVTGVFTQAGLIAGVDGRTFGMILLLIVYIAITAGAFSIGHSTIAMVVGLPFIIMALWLGLFEVALFFVLGTVVIILLMRQAWTGR